MDPGEYLKADATTLAGLVATGQVTAEELLALARRRCDDVDPAVNSVVIRMSGVADERAADPALSGPFAGVPFLVKDIDQDYAGFPTMRGSRAYANDVAQEHALVTQRFLDAGLVIFGKTSVCELGAKGITEPESGGPTRNPWNLDHTPGGSTGGSAAAVAAGIVPAAGGNDGGGSLRIPAACCGLVGMKLSRGISPYGPQTGEQMFGMETQGVLSRTVRDSAALLDAIIGPDPAAEYRGDFPAVPFAELLGRPPGRLRIGYATGSRITPHPDPEAVAAVESAAALLTSLGHRVEEVALPVDDEAVGRDYLTILFALLHSRVTKAKERLGATDADFEADTLACAEIGRAAGARPLLDALADRSVHTRALAAFHQEYDLLLTPTLATPPVRVGALTSPPALQRLSRIAAKARAGKALAASGVMDQIIADNLGWVPYTQLANVTGRPAISVPLHWTRTGLPLGVQFVGRLGADGLLLRLAAELEAAQPWFHRYARLDPALEHRPGQ